MEKKKKPPSDPYFTVMLNKIYDERWKSQGKNQTEFAKAVASVCEIETSINNRYVSRWLSDGEKPAQYFIDAICKVLDIEPDYFVPFAIRQSLTKNADYEKYETACEVLCKKIGVDIHFLQFLINHNIIDKFSTIHFELPSALSRPSKYAYKGFTDEDEVITWYIPDENVLRAIFEIQEKSIKHLMIEFASVGVIDWISRREKYESELDEYIRNYKTNSDEQFRPFLNSLKDDVEDFIEDYALSYKCYIDEQKLIHGHIPSIQEYLPIYLAEEPFSYREEYIAENGFDVSRLEGRIREYLDEIDKSQRPTQ